MKHKKMLLQAYLVLGIVVCFGFAVAAASGWRAPNLGLLDGTSSGRSFGGSWGGGK